MHTIDLGLVEMTLDVMKFAIGRITNTAPPLGFPRTADELQAAVGETITPAGIGGEVAFKMFREVLLPASVSIDHPRHLAFVPASPTRAAVMFDLVTSAASVHGAFWLEGAGCIFAEMQVMRWMVGLTGLPDGAFGVFTSGGTEANLSAMVTAREAWRAVDPARAHVRGLVLAADSAHSSIHAMAKVIDVEVRFIPVEDRFEAGHLEAALTALSPADRTRTFAVIATGGTTNAGVIDELDGLGRVCAREGVWFHVDAAYGGGALAAPSARPAFAGIERADSITIDPHKWLFSPYDCGAVIYRRPELARAAHAQEGSYLDIFSDPAMQGFNPSDYQIQLTRRVRGLPLWFSLAMHGTDRYAQAIERGLELAQIAARLIEAHPHAALVRPPSLSCVLFRRPGWTRTDYRDWTLRNQRAGFALVTPTRVGHGPDAEAVGRFCFINPDTTEADIQAILDTLA